MGLCTASVLLERNASEASLFFMLFNCFWLSVNVFVGDRCLLLNDVVHVSAHFLQPPLVLQSISQKS